MINGFEPTTNDPRRCNEAICEIIRAGLDTLKARKHISKWHEFAEEIGLTYNELTNRLNGKTPINMRDLTMMLIKIREHDSDVYEWCVDKMLPKANGEIG